MPPDDRVTVPTHDLEVVVAGERLVLLPERVVYWPRRSMLLVADPHFGKAATFRAEGLPVPHGTTDEGLLRLGSALRRIDANHVVFLGDFLHAKSGRAPATLEAIGAWTRAQGGIRFELVRGNHDRRAGDPPSETGVACVDPPMLESPFVLVHHPAPAAAGYVLAGHLHPGIRLAGRGGLRERLPCFWFGERVGVLPAFGDFTGLALVEPEPEDRVFAVAGDALVEVSSGAA